MNKAGEYRACAAQCLRLAKTASDIDDRTLLVSMAERWLDLADRLEGGPGSSISRVKGPPVPSPRRTRH
jgi:hypothetical protein